MRWSQPCPDTAGPQPGALAGLKSGLVIVSGLHQLLCCGGALASWVSNGIVHGIVMVYRLYRASQRSRRATSERKPTKWPWVAAALPIAKLF